MVSKFMNSATIYSNHEFIWATLKNYRKRIRVIRTNSCNSYYESTAMGHWQRP